MSQELSSPEPAAAGSQRPEQPTLAATIARRLNQELGIAVARIEETLRLLDQGATVPFIARYRKASTGNPGEALLQEIRQKYGDYRTLEERRQAVTTRLAHKGVLTDELRERLETAPGENEIEDLHLPYRPQRRSRGGVARERGLAPLADYLLDPTGSGTPREFASALASPDGDVPTADDALRGAVDILAERFAENPDHRHWLRQLMLEEGTVHSVRSRGRAAGKDRFSQYRDFREAVGSIPSHRFLAIRRGVREKALSYSVEIDVARARETFRRRVGLRPERPWSYFVGQAADDAYERLLEPAIQAQVRTFLRSRAENEAIRVFEDNLRALLLAPPAGRIPVLGIEAGHGRSLRLAAVDADGKLLEGRTLSLQEPPETTTRALGELAERHRIRGIAIGGRTGSREAEELARSALAGHADIFVVTVHSGGASTWAASPAAKAELPDLDAATRSAVSIARRLQDPLAELVKIDPKAIGVGQYQHDVNQKRLERSLANTLESAVGRVGADVNTATVDLLKHVPGLGEARARAIVDHREAHGPFRNRQELLSVPGLDEDTFRQAAGFLRIPDGSHPLDRTAIHPEAYAEVERMAASLGVELSSLPGDRSLADRIRGSEVETALDRFTLEDVRAQLLRPGGDERRRFTVPKFRDDVRSVGDLSEGMELEGRVTNVTNFGAFVDIGVHQDGLIHISELSHRYVADPRKALGVGDPVKVRVTGIDPKTKRISLSRKAMMPRPQPRPKPRAKAPERPPEPKPVDAEDRERRRAPKPVRKPARHRKPDDSPPSPPLSMEEKIRRLQEKFRGPGR